MDLDLSSLEGPPIQDSRFTIHPAQRNDCLPRPASSGATTPRYHKTETHSARRKSEEITSPISGRGLLHPLDRRWPSSEPERRPRALSQPKPNQHNDRLIWFDQERIWILFDHSDTASTGNGAGVGTDSGSGAGNGNDNGNGNAPTNNRPTLSHSRSAESYIRGPPSINIEGTGMEIASGGEDDDDDGDYDLPPPYENHYNDTILTPQPTRQLARQNHCTGRVSPWVAVARRMNRGRVESTGR